MVPSLPYEDEQPVATKKTPNDELRIGPTTRARAKLLEQQVNSLLVDNTIYFDESFILPKSLCVCIVRYIGEEGMAQGSKEALQQGKEKGLEEKTLQSSQGGSTASIAVVPLPSRQASPASPASSSPASPASSSR